ncbi:hypothetical protein PROFUN_07175 [Planoprotostelium fungivorum]|uniref:PNPLA domain-containing protein n=1 Tax=Planoprotostelium fungivorum TaxID=1890364 RepID=A0A2P6NMB4_9EUKA|nr:hypothetical protein PROFUN_07175 [Planoprotostelium fungivorum]
MEGFEQWKDGRSEYARTLLDDSWPPPFELRNFARVPEHLGGQPSKSTKTQDTPQTRSYTSNTPLDNMGGDMINEDATTSKMMVDPPGEKGGKSKKPFRILALDGGGARGILQAALLKRISIEYPALFDNIDMFTGTSAGSLNAAALASGKTIDQLLNIWTSEAGRVFSKSCWRKIRSVNYIFEAAYDNKALKDMAEDVVGKTTIGDLNKKILIPSFNLDPNDDTSGGGNIPQPPTANGDVSFIVNDISGLTHHSMNPILTPFKSLGKDIKPNPFPKDRRWFPEYFHNFSNSSNKDTTLLDACLSSAAAPTYFPIYKGFVDGGVFANNPSLACITACICEGIDLRDICILSLSTGNNPQYIGKEKYGTGNWGIYSWGLQLIDMLTESTSSAATHQAACLLGKQFLRLDPLLPSEIELDDASPETLQSLMDLSNKIDIKPVVDWLKTYFTVGDTVDTVE